MTGLQTLFAIISASAVLSVFLMLIIDTIGKSLPQRVKMIIPAVTPAIALIPVNGQPIYTYIRGIIGDLSILSQGLILAAILQRLTRRQLIDAISMNKLCIVIPLMGIALYPAALGLIPIDTYEWGFHGIGLPITLLLIMLLLLLTRATLLAGLMVTAALLASINAMESNNIWDYIIDPLLFIYTGFQLLKLTYNQQKRLNQ